MWALGVREHTEESGLALDSSALSWASTRGVVGGMKVRARGTLRLE